MNGYQDTRQKRQKLCQEAETLQCTSDGAQDSHFPINRLPRDILSEIFVRCLPEIQRPWPACGGRSASDVAPLLLCNVCSSWRALALSTPRLWQRLFLKLTETMAKSKKKDIIAMTHVWIKRSGVLPLTLSLYLKTTDLADSTRNGQALGQGLVDALTHYSSRWEHVQLRFPDLLVTLPQLEYMPCLRTIDMLTQDPGHTQFPFPSCPKLTGISWPCRIALTSAPLPWSQLTHANLHASTRETLFVIQSCPMLESVEVSLFYDLNRSASPKMIVSKSLRNLKLVIDQTCNGLIKRLTLPALTDLSVHFDPDFGLTRGFQKGLLGLFSRSKCKLDRLDLRHCGFDDATLSKCYKHDSCVSVTKFVYSQVGGSWVISVDQRTTK